MLEQYIAPYGDVRIYWAKEVTFDYNTDHPIRVDYMKFKPINNTVSGIEKSDVYCYEVKSSVEDFHSKKGHNFIGDLNYYVMLKDTYEQIICEIPYVVGVLCPDQWGKLQVVKKAKRKDRNRPLYEVLLMMFRSFTRDERKKDND